MESLANRKVFVTAGIGDPSSFARELETSGCNIVGTRWFADHHAFQAADISDFLTAATLVVADRVVTTEKDWVKIKSLCSNPEGFPPIVVVRLEIGFREDQGSALLQQIEMSLVQ